MSPTPTLNIYLFEGPIHMLPIHVNTDILSYNPRIIYNRTCYQSWIIQLALPSECYISVWQCMSLCTHFGIHSPPEAAAERDHHHQHARAEQLSPYGQFFQQISQPYNSETYNLLHLVVETQFIITHQQSILFGVFCIKSIKLNS
jgi:hypothetical protein